MEMGLSIRRTMYEEIYSYVNDRVKRDTAFLRRPYRT